MLFSKKCLWQISPVKTIDLKTFVTGDMLIESEFLTKTEDHDWGQYQDEMVLIRGCSDIIIHTWAYMTVAARLAGVAKTIRYGNEHSNLTIYRHAKAQPSSQ